MLRHQQKIGLVVISVVAIWTGLAQAQPGGGGRGGRGGFGGGGFGGPAIGGPEMGGIFVLVGNPAVQKEIGLEGDAADKAQKIAASFQEERMSALREATPGLLLGNLQGLSPEEQRARMRETDEKMAAVMKTLNEKFMPQLKEVVSAPQVERLREINWQAAGSRALIGPDLRKSLELTQEQHVQISVINVEFQRKQLELGGGFGRGGGGRGGPPDFDAMQARMQKVQALDKERDAKAVEVLSSEQQEKYAKLKGKPFDVAQLQMGFGGFGGRGGGFGGRGGSGGGPGGGPGGGAGGRPRGAAGRPQNNDEKKE